MYSLSGARINTFNGHCTKKNNTISSVFDMLCGLYTFFSASCKRKFMRMKLKNLKSLLSFTICHKQDGFIHQNPLKLSGEV